MMEKYMVTWKGGQFNLWNNKYFKEEKEALEFFKSLNNDTKELRVKRRNGGYTLVLVSSNTSTGV